MVHFRLSSPTRVRAHELIAFGKLCSAFYVLIGNNKNLVSRNSSVLSTLLRTGSVPCDAHTSFAVAE